MLARVAGVGHRVHVIGQVSEADLAALYSRAVAVAVPSRAEGFGFPVVEAMAHATPVVISDDPALVEVAGGASIVAPVGDAEALGSQLASLVSDETRRQELIGLGLTRVQQFSWEIAARTMWSLYASSDLSG